MVPKIFQRPVFEQICITISTFFLNSEIMNCGDPLYIYFCFCTSILLYTSLLKSRPSTNLSTRCYFHLRPRFDSPVQIIEQHNLQCNKLSKISKENTHKSKALHSTGVYSQMSSIKFCWLAVFLNIFSLVINMRIFLGYTSFP